VPQRPYSSRSQISGPTATFPRPEPRIKLRKLLWPITCPCPTLASDRAQARSSAPSATSRDAMVCCRCRDGRRAREVHFWRASSWEEGRRGWHRDKYQRSAPSSVGARFRKNFLSKGTLQHNILYHEHMCSSEFLLFHSLWGHLPILNI